MTKNLNGHVRPTVRCAVYTRKSTEEGLEQEFNTLDAQRESGEAYVKSQASEGWTCLPDHYDDGGFSGGNIDRPALRRLIADIDAGRIDVVVVYKVDRLSRSLLDFAKLMESFERHHVSFVSVTQQINSATSMGRLMLNVLLSFAQFEREIIGERTRDKIAATRRKGKWAGGHPLLGYDIDPGHLRLLVNDAEAVRVRAIYQLYLEHESLLPVVQELERRGWRNKRWTTRKNGDRGGKTFTRTSLHKLLTNVAYTGKVRYKTEIHEGEHEGIVDPAVWQRVQSILHRNHRTGGAIVRNSTGALLKGLLWCQSCSCAMTPTHSSKNGTKLYRYYICSSAQKRGHATCPTRSIPAGEIERFVVERIKCIGKDPDLVHQTLAAAQSQVSDRDGELGVEQRGLQRDLSRWHSDVKAQVERAGANPDGSALAHLADLHERIRLAERRLSEIRIEIDDLRRDKVTDRDVVVALSAFDPVWGALAPREQARVVHLLIERVAYDGVAGRIAVTFHPTGIKTLAEQLSNPATRSPA